MKAGKLWKYPREASEAVKRTAFLEQYEEGIYTSK
jgi:hypothetical protein